MKQSPIRFKKVNHADDMKTMLGITFSDEVAMLIADNNIDLVAELSRDANLTATRVQRAVWPGASLSETGIKSPELVILASGATSALLGSAIARVLDALTRRKAVLLEEPCPEQKETKTDISFGRLHIKLVN